MWESHGGLGCSTMRHFPGVFSFAIVLALMACTGQANLRSTTLSCPGCPLVEVLSVIDGDTFRSSMGNIRLFGASTPERYQECGPAATQRFLELSGQRVRVERGPRLRSYDRLLFYAYTEDGRSIDELLIRDGLAEAWIKDGQHKDVLTGLEQQARWDGVGCLWGGSDAPSSGAGHGCDSAYPGVCIPPPPPDLHCEDIPDRRFTVLSPDPHGFDQDRDGIGCEN